MMAGTKNPSVSALVMSHFELTDNHEFIFSFKERGLNWLINFSKANKLMMNRPFQYFHLVLLEC